ncbi:phage tail sheath family protein [Pedobacter heparinus]|uniref:phage tail sheath family protein n=1 Tax=Pedobacter heparinus TaxID=984 RepID=UPI002931A98F|nr:phage tail sheath subtilisin-like domain-containing protein [Pedobacter heparinus]
MAKTYKTPGVYVEEVPGLPPSVAQVPTAIPVFIGYTEKAGGNAAELLASAMINDILVSEAKLISSLLEYESYFGKAAVVSTDIQNMQLHLQLFFANGGGPCYIISVGNTTGTPEKNNLLAGLEMAARYDQPSLLVIPQTVQLNTAAAAYEVYNVALLQAAERKDRFVLIDCYGDDPQTLRGAEGIGDAHLKYGAAYHPFLKTTLNAAILPPSAAIAGIYATTDQNRGVWKAPANISLNLVTAPTQQITSEMQDNLNIDEVAGKSVNVIRMFTGKGVLVWGARTLAGNDNEWRYIPVSRLFIMVEQSCKKGMERFIFEPNTANTWIKIRTMLENYLSSLWRQGALQGGKAGHAFYVSIGLGHTMTALDILEGRLIVEIGMAAIRPAEFVILKLNLRLNS